MMTRRPKHSGQHDIDHARENFEASVKAGRPDYRFVALAIGAAPVAPPEWAMLACIAEKEREEKRSAAVAGGDSIDAVLDELIRFYDREQQRRTSAGHLNTAKPTSLRAALMAVYELLGEVSSTGYADDGWLRTARRAWEREQKEDRRESYFVLAGWNITGRIERVLMALQGPEFGYPSDPVKELWLQEEAGRSAKGLP